MFLISTCTYMLSFVGLGLLLGLFPIFGPCMQNAVKQYSKFKLEGNVLMITSGNNALNNEYLNDLIELLI